MSHQHSWDPDRYLTYADERGFRRIFAVAQAVA